MNKFKNITELKKEVRKGNIPDNFVLNKIIYTQDEYDSKGEIITYKNKRTTNQIIIMTENRYEYGFKDAEIVLDEDIGYYREGFSYLD